MSAITEEARKRQQQNEVERQRREVLNTGFARLAALVPSLHHKNTLPNSSTTSTSPVPAQVSPTSLPASKQMILTETVSHIQKLQAELESMSRALAAADSKCFSLVAELHRMSCVTGLQPNLDAIQESSSNVAPLSPISSPSSSNSENGEEQSRKRVRSQSPTHDSVHLPPLKRQNGDVASSSSNQRQVNDGFFAIPHSPTAIQLPPLASSLSGSLRPAPGVALTQAPTLSRSVSPISTQVSSPPLSSASTQSIVTPVSSFVDRVDGRIIMKAGRRKGTGNSTATKRPVEVSAVSVVPALLFRVPSPTS